MVDNLKVTLIQIPLVWEAANENRTAIEELLRTSVGASDLILLPEMFTSGFTMQPKNVAEPMNGSTLQWMQLLAQKHQAAIGGSLVIQENNQYYNRFLLVTPEGEIDYYDKRHTFTLAGEHKVYKAGENDGLIHYKGWKICLRICYDLRFPVWSRNTSDYDVLIYVANWPQPRIQAWDTLLKARAIENMAYCIGVNRVGTDPNGHQYPGHSAAYDPLGNLITDKISEETLLLNASLDHQSLQVQRRHLPFLKDKDSFALNKNSAKQ